MPARNPPSQPAHPQKQRVRGASSRRRRSGSLERRLKAAGLDGPHGDDVHEIRRRLARRVAMIVNRWHGCREPICRRHRGCMAPRDFCVNIPPLSPEEAARRLPKVQAALRKALQARRAALDSGERSSVRARAPGQARP
jgi:hypothetical protein